MINENTEMKTITKTFANGDVKEYDAIEHRGEDYMLDYYQAASGKNILKVYHEGDSITIFEDDSLEDILTTLKHEGMPIEIGHNLYYYLLSQANQK